VWGDEKNSSFLRGRKKETEQEIKKFFKSKSNISLFLLVFKPNDDKYP
jgi:hypothetical protein